MSFVRRAALGVYAAWNMVSRDTSEQTWGAFWEALGQKKVKSPVTGEDVQLSTLRTYTDNEEAKKIIEREFAAWINGGSNDEAPSEDGGGAQPDVTEVGDSEGAKAVEDLYDAADEMGRHAKALEKLSVPVDDNLPAFVEDLGKQITAIEDEILSLQGNPKASFKLTAKQKLLDQLSAKEAAATKFLASKKKIDTLRKKAKDVWANQAKAIQVEWPDKWVSGPVPEEVRPYRSPSGSWVGDTEPTTADIEQMVERADNDGLGIVVVGGSDDVLSAIEGATRSPLVFKPHKQVGKLADLVGGEIEAKARILLYQFANGEDSPLLQDKAARRLAEGILGRPLPEGRDDSFDEAYGSDPLNQKVSEFLRATEAKILSKRIKTLESEGNLVVVVTKPTIAHGLRVGVQSLPSQVDEGKRLRSMERKLEALRGSWMEADDAAREAQALYDQLVADGAPKSDIRSAKEVLDQAQTVLKDVRDKAKPMAMQVWERQSKAVRNDLSKKIADLERRAEVAPDADGKKKLLSEAKAAKNQLAEHEKKQHAAVFAALGVEPESPMDKAYNALMMLAFDDEKLQSKMADPDEDVTVILNNLFYGPDAETERPQKQESEPKPKSGDAASEDDVESHPEVEKAKERVKSIEDTIQRVVDGDLSQRVEELSAALANMTPNQKAPEAAIPLAQALNDELNEYLSTTTRLFRVNPGTGRLEFLGQEWKMPGKNQSEIMKVLPDMLEKAIRNDPKNKVKFDKLDEARAKARKDLGL